MAEHYTLKWFDLEDTEGGGGSDLIPKPITITYVNHVGQNIMAPSEYCIVDNRLVRRDTPIEDGETVTCTHPVFYYEFEDEDKAVFSIYSFVPSNLVNCTVYEFDGDNFLLITDATKESSATLTETNE